MWCAFPCAHSTCDSIYRSLAKCFPGVHRFSATATDSSTASSSDVTCNIVRSMSARIKAIFISGMSAWVRSPHFTLGHHYFNDLWSWFHNNTLLFSSQAIQSIQLYDLSSTHAYLYVIWLVLGFMAPVKAEPILRADGFALPPKDMVCTRVSTALFPTWCPLGCLVLWF